VILSENLRGAGLMVASMLLFAVNDAFIKSLGGQVAVFQTLFIRTAMVVAILAVAVTWKRGWVQGDMPAKTRVIMWLRAFTEVGAAYFIVTALFNMELVNLTAVLQVLPLAVTLAAFLFLGEPLGWRRLLAIAVGFVGVMLIIQPTSDGFNAYSFHAIGGVVCVTARDIFARLMGRVISAQLMSLQAASMVLIFAFVAGFWETWHPVPPAAWIGLVGSAAAISVGYVVSALVMRHGDIGYTAQFRYAGLLAALVLGYVFFDEWPNALTLLGAVIVVATGLFALNRERRTPKG